MASKLKKKKLFIEAAAIAEDRPSGIGHTIVETIRALSQNGDFTKNYRIILLVPRDMKKKLLRWQFPESVEIRSVIWEKHVLQVLLKYGFLPPMDILLGRGTYLFPNYKTWPLLFSRSLTYIYDASFAMFPGVTQTKNLAMLKRNIPIWIKRTDYVITISKTSKQEIIKYLDCPPEKIGVVYCGVDDKVYKPYPADQVKEAVSRYGIKGPYLLYVGNLEPRKNLIRLLEAYESLPEDLRKKYSLVLVGGGGWLHDKILAKVKELQDQGLNIVQPDTYVPDTDIALLYNGASVLVHPAVHEGFGLPPLQAMSSGVPVAVSRIGAVEEVVGDTGNYFNPLDVASIKKTLEEVLTHPKETQKRASQARQRSKKFNWKASAEELAKHIAEVSES